MRKTTKYFIHKTDGNVALMFGLSLFPILAATGAAIDYSRASNVQSAYKAAADAAALAGAKARVTSNAAAIFEAQKVFDANLQTSGVVNTTTPKITLVGSGGVRVEGVSLLKNSFTVFVGKNTSDVAYMAEAVFESGTPAGENAGDEISLVLDNTGSMNNDMGVLREAANKFVDKVMVGSTKLAVVPFVTAVNVGTKNLSNSHLDVNSKSQWHGTFTRALNDPKTRGSTYYGQNIASASGGCNYGGGGSTFSGPGGGGGKGAILSPKTFFSPGQWDLAQSLQDMFGISTAHAQAVSITPNTILPLQGTMVNTGQFSKNGKQAFLPAGFALGYEGCHLSAPTKVNHFDLLDRMPGARWKGCVEARPEPYDVTDDAPTSGKADTLFTPYFWPDEQDASINWLPAAVNNYMSDGQLPQGWQPNQPTANIFKYDGKNRPNIVETAPDTSGPNKACPTELQRLTKDRVAVKSTIQNMRHWNGGGTILVEGLAWGWRTISPNPPFADGKPYSKEAKKTIVFMSDGANEIGDAPGTENYSHYTGYGYLSSGRFPVMKFNEAHQYLDERFLLACQNAKAKKIRIITILFRNNTGTAASVMEKCATEKKDFYFAGSQQSLKMAFDKIGSQFESTKLKLSK
jgi:Flp pilus assembly protein TadG